MFDQGRHGTLIKCYGYAAAGDKAKAIELLEKIPKETQSMFPVNMSQIHVALGNTEEALNDLELGSKIRDLAMICLKNEPFLGSFKSRAAIQSADERK